jgi:class 3 adenylate cyclase/TolB-like protein
MTSNPIIRKLEAIVIGDVAGYSRLMEQDEGGTHARLREIRAAVIDPQIATFGGRVVRTTGDGMLLEFDSATAAVRFATQVQRTMRVRNQALASDKQIHFRFGINLGDIIIDGSDIAGDGVNIAARLETLSEPGEICISSVVRDQIRDDLGVEFVDIGDQYVKNIARRIRVYRVVPDPDGTRLRVRQRWQMLKRAIVPRGLALGALVLGIVAIAFWLQPGFWKNPPAAASTPVSVAILPFVSSGGATADEKVADALAPSLASSLERSARWAKVISSQLSATYKGSSVDARRVGLELNARYLIEGQVERVGKQGVIKLTVIDTPSATQLWNGHLEFQADQLARGSASVVATLTRQVYLTLYAAEMRRNAGPPPPGASAAELTWHGWAIINRDENTVSGAREAQTWFDQALRLEPGLVLALRGRWRTLRYEYDLDPHADRGQLLKEMDELSFRTTSIDENDSHAWWDRAETLSRQRRWKAALEANARAQRLDPSFGGPRNQRAAIMTSMGNPTEALAIVDEELARNPQEPSEVGAAMLQRCRAHLALGHYGEAIAACEKGIAFDDWWLPNVYLLAAYAQLGDAAHVAATRAVALRLRPGLSISDLKALWYPDSPDSVVQTEGQLLAGLSKAGIPER